MSRFCSCAGPLFCSCPPPRSLASLVSSLAPAVPVFSVSASGPRWARALAFSVGVRVSCSVRFAFPRFPLASPLSFSLRARARRLSVSPAGFSCVCSSSGPRCVLCVVRPAVGAAVRAAASSSASASFVRPLAGLWSGSVVVSASSVSVSVAGASVVLGFPSRS